MNKENKNSIAFVPLSEGFGLKPFWFWISPITQPRKCMFVSTGIVNSFPF